MPIRLIALDLDGTLLNASAQVSERNLAALRLAEACGIEIAIATGRRHCYALRVLRALELGPHRALISSNGTVIRTLDSTLLDRTHMPLATARWLCHHLRDFRNTLVLTFDKVRPDGEDDPGALVCEHLDELHSSIGRWMEVNAPYIAHISPLEDALTADPPIQMMLCGSISRMREAKAHLLRDPRVIGVGMEAARADELQSTLEPAVSPGIEVALHRTEYAARDLAILDILPTGCSKGSALLRLAALRNIPPAEILAIGDNWNDVPMFRVAGHAALMANAPDDLRALAVREGWQIVSSNEEDGVAAAIASALPASAVI